MDKRKQPQSKEHREIDKLRTQQLEQKGFIVIRIWEREIRKMELNDLKIKIGGYS